MREMKHLRTIRLKFSIPGQGLPGVHPQVTERDKNRRLPRIQDSNSLHKTFSGIASLMGVTYPTVLVRPWCTQPPGAVSDFVAEMRIPLGSTIFMADFLPEGCSKIQIDGGSSGYDKVE